MKAGLYFGSFNPVHTGHLIIANSVLNETDLNEVWFVVSPQNPFKNQNALLNENHRLNLIRTAIEGENRLKASSVEFKLPRPSYTIDTLTYLAEKYPETEFKIIIGSDSFQNLPKWKNADLIIKNYELLVYPRPGFKVSNDIHAKIRVINSPMLDISSTRIRYLIAEGKSIRFLLPDSVKEQIENQHYYRSFLENPAKK